jgi:hypothetical protein
MRGLIENAAIRALVKANGFAALPRMADDLIRKFLLTNPVPTVALVDRPFLMLALWHHRRASIPDLGSLEPKRVV